ncbi:hypothetical protein VHEMI04384 [[Torrubiella] hemipterigena]|uniref:Nitroreductase domain-containing protein n=1 Tax=[Torrubiella] hemipterigena TaxID=1531966 RepID=A0A0A1T129_9HYPO|nr:hypothetical protein VHEMI04384 [[Torrubiella] hemipterigena]
METESAADPPRQISMSLETAILSRHSTRLFLPKPVPMDAIEMAIRLANHAPSDSNIQPWKLYILTGASLKNLSDALTAAATEHKLPKIPVLPEKYTPRRMEFGGLLYGQGWGVARDDQPNRLNAALRNYSFFGAPVGLLICMDSELEGEEALSVGLFLQNLLLAFTSMGLGSCAQISIAQYEDVVKREVKIGDQLKVLCGVAVGYEDTEANDNKIRTPRDSVAEKVVFLD